MERKRLKLVNPAAQRRASPPEVRLAGRGDVPERKGIGWLPTVPIFLLVPQVKLPKRLDLARYAERAVDGVPGRIVAKWV